MTTLQLIQRNLAFHWRVHLAVMLGVAVGSAVLTGALLVGDSLRGSLRDRAEAQRAGVDAALVRGQFFAATPDDNAGRSQVGIILHGSIRSGSVDDGRRVNGVTILAGFALESFAGRGTAVVAPAVPQSLAQQLQINPGDEMIVRVPVPATVPSESLLGQREQNQTSIELTLKLASIIADDHPASLFRLQPGFTTPHNVIVPLPLLQGALAKFAPHLVGDSKRMEGHNAILVSGPVGPVQASLRQRLTMADLGLRWATHPYEKVRQQPGWPRSMKRAEWSREFVPRVAEAIDADRDGTLTAAELDGWYGQHGYLSLESHRGIIEAPVAQAVLRAADAAKLRAAPSLVYVANEIKAGDQAIPYSVVAALDPGLELPLGRFLPAGVDTLADDEIILADWQDSPLHGLPIKTMVQLTYFESELNEGRFVETKAMFRLKGYLPLTGAALDPQLTPAFPGVTDRLTVREWNPPFPYDDKRMKPRDDEYWREFRTIPKAFVTLAGGRKLWASRYGDTTSIRLAPAPGQSWKEARQVFEARFMANPGPAADSFAFDDLQSRFQAASRGGQDFGGLFLGFSFFLIASALLLVGLLTRLNLERRASEIGLLLATGWRLRSVRGVLLAEVMMVAAIGALLGLIAAVAYAGGMLALMRVLWPDVAAGSSLRLHIRWVSLIIGLVATQVVAGATIFWALRWFARVSPSALIAGKTTTTEVVDGSPGHMTRLALPIVAVCVVGALATLGAGARISNPQFRAISFFAGGGLLLTASLLLVWRWLRHQSAGASVGKGNAALARLGARNARRNPARSLLTAGLLASAAFLLIAVESFRRRPEGGFEKQSGGSGGCPLIVETTQPVFFDINADAATRDGVLQGAFQQRFQRKPRNGELPEQSARHARERLTQLARVYSFRRSSGDDASCLNLFQAGRPRILGVPGELIHRGGFQFVQSEARTADERANPWLLLETPREDGTIPVVGEQNSLTWMLKKGLGDEIEVPDESGNTLRFRIVGVLKDSVFQSELLISAASFARAFPLTEGFTFHLVEANVADSAEAGELLRSGLARFEPELSWSADRVAAFMAVENTYLTTFQLLGGFGLLLGALGLSVVMLRGVWERRGELALLRALGFRRQALGMLVLSENTLLLAFGLVAGVGSAALSVLPHLASGGSIPWARLAILLGLVTMAGLLAGAFAVRSTLRAPLLPALRKE